MMDRKMVNFIKEQYPPGTRIRLNAMPCCRGMELEELNAFTKAARDIPRSEVPKLKALLEQFEVQDIETAMGLTEHLADYVLAPEISSPQETAIDQLHFMTDDHSAELLISHGPAPPSSLPA